MRWEHADTNAFDITLFMFVVVFVWRLFCFIFFSTYTPLRMQSTRLFLLLNSTKNKTRVSREPFLNNISEPFALMTHLMLKASRIGHTFCGHVFYTVAKSCSRL